MNSYEITYYLDDHLSVSELVEAGSQEEAFEMIRKEGIITLIDESLETRTMCRFHADSVKLATVQIKSTN